MLRETPNPRERHCQVAGYRIDELLLTRIRSEVGKGEHHHRKARPCVGADRPAMIPNPRRQRSGHGKYDKYDGDFAPRPLSNAGTGRKERGQQCTVASVLAIATARRRRIGPASGHSRSKAVAAPRHRLDTAPIRSPAIEHPSQRRDLHRQIAVLDYGSGPHGGDDLVL